MKDYSLTQEELATLRNQLPHGAGRRIAQKLNTTEAFISRVLNGKSYNPYVLMEAIKMRDRAAKKLLKIKSSL